MGSLNMSQDFLSLEMLRFVDIMCSREFGCAFVGGIMSGCGAAC
jgi:hypothetical protein